MKLWVRSRPGALLCATKKTDLHVLLDWKTVLLISSVIIWLQGFFDWTVSLSTR